jgi:hypothetical protein
MINTPASSDEDRLKRAVRLIQRGRFTVEQAALKFHLDAAALQTCLRDAIAAAAQEKHSRFEVNFWLPY